MASEIYSSYYFRKSGLCIYAGEAKPRPPAALGGPAPMKTSGCGFRESGTMVRGMGHLTGLVCLQGSPERLFRSDRVWEGRGGLTAPVMAAGVARLVGWEPGMAL